MKVLKLSKKFKDDSNHVQDEHDEIIHEQISGTANIKTNFKDRLSKNGTTSENVTVYEKDSEPVTKRKIDINQIHSLIRNNDKVEQVIIEQIRPNDATKVSLLFNQLKGESRPGKELVSDQRDMAITHQASPIENKLNQNQILLLSGQLALNLLSSNEHFHIQLADSRNNKKNNTLFDENEIEEKFAGPDPVKLKTKNSSKKSNLSKERSVETDDLEFEKHVFSRKKKKLSGRYYYKANNHLELFKVGSSYFEDFKKGSKSFAFTCINVHEEVQKLVFGVMSFFNYHSENRVTIITSHFVNSFYSKYLSNYTIEHQEYDEQGNVFEFYTVNGVDVIEYSEISRLFDHLDDFMFEKFLEKFVDNADLILWDLPEMKQMNEMKEVFFPITRYVDNVSFVVKENFTRADDINLMKDYFNKYGVQIKGLILSNDVKEKKVKK